MGLRLSKKKLVEHVVDTTSQVVSMSPIYSAVEVTALGMPDQLSIDAKVNGAVMGYLGTGWLYARGRDVLDGMLKVPEKGVIRSVFDTGYTMAFSALLAPTIYLLSGERDPETLATSAGVASLIGACGFIPGYAIDTGRDLAGIARSKRWFPEAIRESSPKVKKGIGALAAATSIAIMAGIYALTPPGHNEETISLEGRPALEEQVMGK